MRFIVDAQLPPQLAAWFRAKGHEAFAVREIGLRDADDPEIWRRATTDNDIIVSKDEDFATMALQPGSGPQVLWVRTGNILTRSLIQHFEQTWEQAEVLLEADVRLVELR